MSLQNFHPINLLRPCKPTVIHRKRFLLSFQTTLFHNLSTRKPSSKWRWLEVSWKFTSQQLYKSYTRKFYVVVCLEKYHFTTFALTQLKSYLFLLRSNILRLCRQIEMCSNKWSLDGYNKVRYFINVTGNKCSEVAKDISICINL